jgi:hypothetical protein
MVSTARSESRCALRLRYVDLVKRVQVCIDARGLHFQHILKVHSDFPNALYYNITIVLQLPILFSTVTCCTGL